MNSYFSNFELIPYNNLLMVNIAERAVILNKIFSNRYVFYPYTVKNGMRPEQVAEKYYGDPNLVWIVYLSNNIIDPYYDWTMDDETFNQYLTSKYGSVDTAKSTVAGYRVNWYEDTTILSTDQYAFLNDYEKKYWTPNFNEWGVPISYVRKRIDISLSSKDANGVVVNTAPTLEHSYWESFSQYDVEEENNVRKSHIRLLDNRLAQSAATNLRELLQ